MISIVACCRGAKLCAHAARNFRSQHNEHKVDKVYHRSKLGDRSKAQHSLQKYHRNIQLTSLWLFKKCVNSKQALPPLRVWNHLVFPFFDRFCATDCQILS